MESKNPIIRRKTKKVKVGNIYIGGDAPISVQSMTVNKTYDVEKTLKEMDTLVEAGCQVIRVTVPDKKSAMAIEEYKKAADLYPWETHYTVMMNRDIERFIPHVKDKDSKITLLKSALEHYRHVQQIDPINPWYYSRMSNLQSKLAMLIRDRDINESRSLLLNALSNTRKASQIDFENLLK